MDGADQSLCVALIEVFVAISADVAGDADVYPLGVAADTDVRRRICDAQFLNVSFADVAGDSDVNTCEVVAEMDFRHRTCYADAAAEANMCLFGIAAGTEVRPCSAGHMSIMCFLALAYFCKN